MGNFQNSTVNRQSLLAPTPPVKGLLAATFYLLIEFSGSETVNVKKFSQSSTFIRPCITMQLQIYQWHRPYRGLSGLPVGSITAPPLRHDLKKSGTILSPHGKAPGGTICPLEKHQLICTDVKSHSSFRIMTQASERSTVACQRVEGMGLWLSEPGFFFLGSTLRKYGSILNLQVMQHFAVESK